MSFSAPAPFPPFPPDIPQISSETLSLSKILSDNDAERKKLFRICSSTGIFVLDLVDTERGAKLMQEVDDIFYLSEAIFNLDLEVKRKYSMLNGTVLGYKGAGVGRIDAKGTPDRCEFWCMSKDDVLGTAPMLPAPELVNTHRELYASFAKSCHELSMMILERLECELCLPSGTFRARHRIDQISSDQSRQIRYDPQPDGDRRTSLVPHTDYGSITMLFNVLGGLQILPEGKDPEKDEWLWVKPAPRCAIVNLGDAMIKFTNGLFKSPLHRVTYAPGDQAQLTRYSLAYFTRPEDSCLMEAIEGSSRIPKLDDDEDDIVTAGEWVRTRVRAAQVQKEERAKFPKWATRGLR